MSDGNSTGSESAGSDTTGIDPARLDDETLLRELTYTHEKRNDTFLHGSDDALAAHTARQEALEAEYLRRFPQRDVNPGRTREGARERG